MAELHPNGGIEMAAAERRDEEWDELQKRREERMRYDILLMLYQAADRCAEFPVEIGGFVRKVGVWQEELDRVLHFLGDREYVRLSDDTPRTACLTVRGIDYIERDSSRRRSIRD